MSRKATDAELIVVMESEGESVTQAALAAVEHELAIQRRRLLRDMPETLSEWREQAQ